MKNKVLIALSALVLTALHLSFQPPAQAVSPVTKELKSMLKHCSGDECQAIRNVLAKRGVK